MLNKMQNDSFSWMLLIGALLLLVEITFFNQGLIFSLFVSGAMIYFGRKLYSRVLGKMLFWIGLFTFASSVFGMMTFRLLLLAALLFLIIQFAQSKKKPEVIRPMLEEPSSPQSETTIIEQSSLFKNTVFGHQKTPQHVYEWDDVNIVTGVGDTVIDLSYTVLPKGETVIFIRNIVGNMKIYVPYDTEVNLRHSSFVGSANVLDFQRERSFNQMLAVKTPDYDQAVQKVKIFTSSMIGDIEVKRI
ncbi:lia operon protein LiaF [Mesobacillus persicus]|uniref:Lia operon protein LiaF n=1 Tax=Mesobacillus persicus TaxID=930146 RepID=A0A1H8CHM9_9BACI|nr:cell wall-active antibiotics response protein LiaF [Mesobacillus persicus]SEM94791.1 lia operon protein LiaF [Mesobacillus persicus]